MRYSVAGGLDAVDFDALVVEEGVEQAHGIGAAADAGDERIRQPAFGGHHLLAGLAADHRLEVAHHHRIGVRPGDGADAVEGVIDIGDPVAQRLVHGVLEGLGAGLHRPHLGAEQLHAKHVRLLPRDVDCAHVDHAFEAEAGAQRRGGDAVLAGAGLRDHPRLAHALRQHDLAEHVVDLVRAGMIELVALEIDFGAAAPAGRRRCLAQMLGEPLGEIERRWAADIVGEVALHLPLEFGIDLGRGVGLLELEDQRHQRLGDEAPAEQCRNGRARPARCGRNWVARGSCLSCHSFAAAGRRGARRADEGADPLGVFFAGRPFDPGRHVDPARAGHGDGLGDIAGVETA